MSTSLMFASGYGTLPAATVVGLYSRSGKYAELWRKADEVVVTN